MRKSFLAKPEYKEEDSMVYLTLKNNNMDDSRVLVEQKRLLIERELPNLNDTSKNIIMELSQSIT
ncbi:MAG: hypothetical protein LBD88_04020 [Candidatus Peribacteria bacterium]|jgi:hypothetical protein|nr:hypothetical protein [Candidatus Peribacteria bacterium]